MKRTYPGQTIVNTIRVENLDFTVMAIEENGGEIIVPMQTIPGVGRHCYFKDPSGHIHGAMERQTG